MAGLEDGVRYCANKENTGGPGPRTVTLFGKLQSYAFQQLLLVLALILLTIALLVATWLTKQRKSFLHKKNDLTFIFMVRNHSASDNTWGHCEPGLHGTTNSSCWWIIASP